MKNIFKKMFAILMVFAFAVTVNAAADGSITITNSAANTDVNYNVYKLLDMTYDETTGSVAYTINPTWATFFNQADVKELITTTTSEDGTVYVTKINSEASAKLLAEKAVAYAKANNISATKSATILKNETQTTVSGLELGYYLVDSTLGALVHLDSTKKTATINEKNGEPTITKEVRETTTGIGKTLHYTITVDVKAGAENYKITDVLSKGLTLNENSFAYTYTGTYNGVNPTANATVNSNSKETTFVIDYTGKDLTNVSKIVITYTATVNKDAVALNEVENDAKLEYGRNNTIVCEPVKTDLGQFSIKKTNDSNEDLDGATFKLYKGDAEVKLVLDGNYYRPALEGETPVVITIGTATIKGLEIGEYQLEEISAPTGYTKLASKVVISATKNGNETAPFAVVNTKGAVLTPTGGIGTTLFVTIGSIMVIACGLILVSKFRMSRI